MRVVENKLEHLIKCQCGLSIAYTDKEYNVNIRCPRCGQHHHLDLSHDLYMLTQIKVHYPDNTLMENNCGI